MASEPTRDVFRQDLPADRVLTADDLQRLRFGVALRGYSMSQVDDVLDRLSGELAGRDERIAELEARLGDQPSEARFGDRPDEARFADQGDGSVDVVGTPGAHA